MKTPFLIIIFSVVSCLFSPAQESELADISESTFPKLADVIDAALINSPLLRKMDKEKEAALLESVNSRREWLDNIYIDGSVNYGMLDQIALTELTSSGSSSGFLTTSQQLRYYGGLTVKMPLSEIFGRKNSEKLRSSEVEIAEVQFEEKKEELILIITGEYFQLLYLFESMKSFSEILQAFRISYLKAENDLREGKLSVGDFAMIASANGKAKDDYEKARYNYFAQYIKLQRLTGLKLAE